MSTSVVFAECGTDEDDGIWTEVDTGAGDDFWLHVVGGVLAHRTGCDADAFDVYRIRFFLLDKDDAEALHKLLPRAGLDELIAAIEKAETGIEIQRLI